MADLFEFAEGAPTEFRAGDTVLFKLSDLAEYPLDEFDIRFRIAALDGTGDVVSVDAVAGDGFVSFTIAAASTGALAAGEYLSRVEVERQSDNAVREVDSDRVRVLAGLGADHRTVSRRMLDAIDARLAGRVVKDADAYTIDGRSITRIPFAELRKAREHYAAKVAMENRPGGITRRDAWSGRPLNG